jgi:8-oxo-dGTP pyrophosphatase MutT (NUDIX family)
VSERSSPLRVTRDVVREALLLPPVHNGRGFSTASPRPAATVLAITFDPEPHVAAILRAAALVDHANEVAFPGGKREGADRDLRATAFRELEEELGIQESDTVVLGALSPVPVMTGYVIHPFVAELANGVKPRIASTEIARLLSIPLLPWLTGEREWVEVAFPYGEREIRLPHYELDECILYGASACTFHELLTKIASVLKIPFPSPRLSRELPWKPVL